MREIKFRAWDKSGIMTYQDYSIGAGDILKRFETFIMQYTGLKDKNGVEIYEGDIVDIEGDLFTMIFEEGSFRPLNKTITKSSFMWGVFESSWKEKLIVVSNIYDNPGLLEEKE